MIDVSTFPDIANIDLGKFSPKPTSLEGDQLEAWQTLYRSPDGVIEIGVWECTPGRHVSADRSLSSETSHVIAGHVEIRRANGEIQCIGPGDVLVLPQGWKGEWRVFETVRKLYIIYKPQEFPHGGLDGPRQNPVVCEIMNKGLERNEV